MVGKCIGFCIEEDGGFVGMYELPQLCVSD